MGSSRLVYHCIMLLFEQIRSDMKLPLGKWQALNLAALSFGIAHSRNCTLSVVAERLTEKLKKLKAPGLRGKADSAERRIQRFVANSRVDVEACMLHWCRWIIGQWVNNGAKELVLLVDETKLSNHLSIMMVAVAYRRRAIPLVWSCYPPNEGPSSQLQLIIALLKRVGQALDEVPRMHERGVERGVAGLVSSGARIVPLIQADRGIGTDAELARYIQEMGWHYLLRVQGQTHFYSQGECAQQSQPLQTHARPGCKWRSKGKGWAFKKGGWVECWAQIIWRKEYKEPWCLLTNREDLQGEVYAVRAWQEQAFRDLKSGGWQWQRSHVWQASHAQRLVLALALSYAWVLSLGTAVLKGTTAQRRQVTRGRSPHYGVLRLGLRYMTHLLSVGKPIPVHLPLVPHFPFC